MNEANRYDVQRLKEATDLPHISAVQTGPHVYLRLSSSDLSALASAAEATAELQDRVAELLEELAHADATIKAGAPL